jgi:cobalt-zinc-cadmium efflux system membrane fusion protein
LPPRIRCKISVLFVLLGAFALASGCGEERSAHAQAHGHGEPAATPAAEGPDPGVDTALGEHPAFEWMGVYTIPQGSVDLVIQPGPDASMNIALVPVGSNLDGVVQEAKRIAEAQPTKAPPGTTIVPDGRCYGLEVGHSEEMRFPLKVPAAGKYALFTQHFADEFQTLFQGPAGQVELEDQRIFKSRFGQIRIPPEAVRAFGIKMEAARAHALKPSFTVPARISFNEERVAHVGAAVAGRVAELKVRQGETVKKGDVLLVLDSPELGEAQSDFLQTRTNVATASPTVELTQSAYERAKALYDKNQGIALTEVQKRQTEYQAAQGALLSAKSALAAAENKLHLLGMDHKAVDALANSAEIDPKYTIRAAMDGEVTRRDVTLGELVLPDKESLIVLADLSTVWVLAEVPEAKLSDVAVGSPATISVPALKDQKFEGAVSYVAPELDPSTRTVRVRIEVKNEGGRLKPGMFAQAEISQPSSPTTRAVLAVPDTAVQTIEGKPVVFVPMADKPNTFVKRPVTLESAVGALWPVRYGLKEGETIVTDATFILKAELGKSGAKHEH